MSQGYTNSMARRTSYASVLSGAAASSNSQPSRSGFLAGSSNQGQGTSQIQDYLSNSRSGNRSSDPSFNRPRSRDTYDSDGLPPYPGAMSKWSDGLGGTMIEPRASLFFVPSYLRHSRHMERLENKNSSRERSLREGRSARSSMGGTISRSGSGINLQKMVPSHRGMTYEIQERYVPSGAEDIVAPLPTRCSSHDKCSVLEISGDGAEVKFTGQFKTGSVDDAATVRADNPVPRACGIYYFEIIVLGRGKEGFVGMGFAGPKAALNRFPGWEPECYAYHGDDGYKFGGQSAGTSYGPKFGNGDIVGCGIDFKNGTIFFTKNGVNVGVAFRDIKGDKFFPAVGMKKPGEHVKVNFGQEPFAFDIDGLVAAEREDLQKEIDSQDASHLHPQRNENALLQELVGQYLSHEGYTETINAFSDEVKSSISHLRGPEAAEASSIVYKEDPNAVKRQRIRSAVLEGKVQEAIDLTDNYYPTVLRDNENIYFKLRCRKFIELIKKSTDLQPRSKRPSTSSTLTRHSKSGSLGMGTNGHAHMSRDDLTRMDVDVENGAGAETAIVDASPSEGVYLQQSNLMNEALMYGRKLQNEFKDDPRREVKQALEDTFALIAYPDARDSSLAHLLEDQGRVPVAEELNSAILVSLGQSSYAALEKLIQQTDVLCQDISADGGGAALLNLRTDYLR